MRWQILVVGIGVLVGGCRHAAPKPVAGEWYSEDRSAKTDLQLATDGTFLLVAANDFAGGFQQGRYTQSEDHIDLVATYPGAVPPISYIYRWIDPDKIAMRMDIPGSLESIYQRKGPAAATAAIPGTSPADIAKAHVSAEATTCLSNVKQLALGMQMYSQDYDNALPPAITWATNLLPYVKYEASFSCPTLLKANEQGGIAMDSRLDQIKMAAIQDPRSTVVLFESVNKQIGTSDAQTSLLMKPRHGTRISVGYADGHAKGIER